MNWSPWRSLDHSHIESPLQDTNSIEASNHGSLSFSELASQPSARVAWTRHFACATAPRLHASAWSREWSSEWSSEHHVTGEAKRFYLSPQRREHDRLSDHASRHGLHAIEVASAAGEAPGEHHANQRALPSTWSGASPQLQHDLADRRKDRAVGTKHHLRRPAHGPGDRAAHAILVTRIEQSGTLARVHRRWHRIAGAGEPRSRVSGHVRGPTG